MVQGTVTNASNLTWNAIISGSPYFVGKYISVTYYEDFNAAVKQYVNVKIENDSTDFFRGFRAGINNNTREAFDKVTVHTQGVAFSRSELLAKLIAKGQDHTISNYTSGGLDWIVKVNEIDLGATPPFAEIDIYLEGFPDSLVWPRFRYML
jgi:hypothetical protein